MALFFYTRKIVVNFDLHSDFQKPKILASNHPNSFFDAIVIAVNYPKPIYFLARGDAFKNKIIAKFLKSIQLIPIYRLSEGKENLSKNDKTFKTCIDLLKKNETVLIFSEGLCVNEWQLRNLKKGTARLALMAFNADIKTLLVQPVNLNYSSFTKHPKDILLNFNKPIEVQHIETTNEANFYSNFNSQLKKGLLERMILKTEVNDITIFSIKKNYFKLSILALPAFIGFVSQYWVYKIIKQLAIKKTKNTVFYDSVLFGLLFIIYPILVVVVSLFFGFIINSAVGFLLLITLPLTAYCYKEFKNGL